MTAVSEYPKLIRDNIPEIIIVNGGKPATRVLTDDTEFLDALLKKVVEEANELLSASSETNLLEEIADIREVLAALLELKGVSEEQIQAIQDAKRQKRGGFTQRLLMLHND